MRPSRFLLNEFDAVEKYILIYKTEKRINENLDGN